MPAIKVLTLEIVLFLNQGFKTLLSTSVLIVLTKDLRLRLLSVIALSQVVMLENALGQARKRISFMRLK